MGKQDTSQKALPLPTPPGARQQLGTRNEAIDAHKETL